MLKLKKSFNIVCLVCTRYLVALGCENSSIRPLTIEVVEAYQMTTSNNGSASDVSETILACVGLWRAERLVFPRHLSATSQPADF